MPHAGGRCVPAFGPDGAGEGRAQGGARHRAGERSARPGRRTTPGAPSWTSKTPAGPHSPRDPLHRLMRDPHVNAICWPRWFSELPRTRCAARPRLAVLCAAALAGRRPPTRRPPIRVTAKPTSGCLSKRSAAAGRGRSASRPARQARLQDRGAWERKLLTRGTSAELANAPARPLPMPCARCPDADGGQKARSGCAEASGRRRRGERRAARRPGAGTSRDPAAWNGRARSASEGGHARLFTTEERYRARQARCRSPTRWPGAGRARHLVAVRAAGAASVTAAGTPSHPDRRPRPPSRGRPLRGTVRSIASTTPLPRSWRIFMTLGVRPRCRTCSSRRSRLRQDLLLHRRELRVAEGARGRRARLPCAHPDHARLDRAAPHHPRFVAPSSAAALAARLPSDTFAATAGPGASLWLITPAPGLYRGRPRPTAHPPVLSDLRAEEPAAPRRAGGPRSRGAPSSSTRPMQPRFTRIRGPCAPGCFFPGSTGRRIDALAQLPTCACWSPVGRARPGGARPLHPYLCTSRLGAAGRCRAPRLGHGVPAASAPCMRSGLSRPPARCAALFADQPYNARRIESLGAGIAGDRLPDVGLLAVAVERVLGPRPPPRPPIAPKARCSPAPPPR